MKQATVVFRSHSGRVVDDLRSLYEFCDTLPDEAAWHFLATDLDIWLDEAGYHEFATKVRQIRKRFDSAQARFASFTAHLRAELGMEPEGPLDATAIRMPGWPDLEFEVAKRPHTLGDDVEEIDARTIDTDEVRRRIRAEKEKRIAGIRRETQRREEASKRETRQREAVSRETGGARDAQRTSRYNERQHSERTTQVEPDASEEHATAKSILRRGLKVMAGGDWPGAESLFRKATQIEPDGFEGWLNLGVALHSQRKHAEARAAYEKVLDLEPDHPTTHYNLALVSDALGDRERAIALMRQYIMMADANDPEQREWLPHARRSLARWTER
jgi:Flp pilus assembly protein TadD